MTPPTHDPEFVLEHSRFVRALVQRLVFDAELARDVEQEVWLAALRHARPLSGSPRAWLSALAHNLARKAWRTRARRERREAQHGEPRPATPTPAEILERESLRREVVEALLALDDPWREALILRYLEELSSREVAQRLGVPHETVRTRIKRGVELLRARLARRGGRDGASLALLLVEAWNLPPPTPWAPLGALAKSAWNGVLLVNVLQKSLVAAAAVVVIATAVHLTREGEPAAPEDVRAAAPASERPPAPPVEEPSDSAPRVEAARAELAAPPPAVEAPAQARASTATLIVRAVWAEDSSPAEAVGVTVYSSEARDYYHGRQAELTGADGLARFEGLAPGKLTIASDRGSFSATRAAAGETAEVTLTLPAGFEVRGRVIDASSAPVAGAEVYLWGSHETTDRGFVAARADVNGEYRVRGLPSGGLSFLSARAPGREPTQQRLVMAGVGGAIEVDLVFSRAGGALAGRVFAPDGAPLASAVVVVGASMGPFDVVRFADGAEGRAAAAQRSVTDELGRFRFDGVAAGELAVRVRAPGLAPWQGTTEVQVGRTASLDVVLAEGVTLTGAVRDDSGAPVPGARLSVGGASELFVAMTRTDKDGTFEIQGLAAGEFEVTAKAPNLGQATAKLAGVPGQTLRWDAVLADDRLTLRARLVPPPEAGTGWSLVAERFGPEGHFFQSVACDSEGRFAIPGCPQGALKLTLFAAGASYFPQLVVEEARAGAAEVVLQLDPARAPSVRLRGRIVGADGQAIGSAKLLPVCSDFNSAPNLDTDPDSGRFELGPFPPGEWSLLVMLEGFGPVRTTKVRLAQGESHDFGDIVLQQAGRVIVRFASEPDVDTSGTFAYLSTEDGRSAWLALDGRTATSERLAPGRYVLVSGAKAAATTTRELELLAGEELALDVTLRAGIATRVSALYEDGDALTGSTRLQVSNALGHRCVDLDLDPAEQRTSWTVQLLPGRYRATARDAQGRSGVLEFAVPADGVELLEPVVRLR